MKNKGIHFFLEGGGGGARCSMEDVQMANTFLTYFVLCKKFDACTKFFFIRVNVWTVHRDKFKWPL